MGTQPLAVPVPLSISHYFYHARFLLCSPLCLAFPCPHPFPPHLCLSLLLSSLTASLRCGLPPRNKPEFSIHISASVPPSYFNTSLLQLSFSTSVLLFPSSPSTHQPSSLHQTSSPQLPLASVSPSPPDGCSCSK